MAIFCLQFKDTNVLFSLNILEDSWLVFEDYLSLFQKSYRKPLGLLKTLTLSKHAFETKLMVSLHPRSFGRYPPIPTRSSTPIYMPMFVC